MECRGSNHDVDEGGASMTYMGASHHDIMSFSVRRARETPTRYFTAYAMKMVSASNARPLRWLAFTAIMICTDNHNSDFI